jgi:exosortase/archaeosortase
VEASTELPPRQSIRSKLSQVDPAGNFTTNKTQAVVGAENRKQIQSFLDQLSNDYIQSVIIMMIIILFLIIAKTILTSSSCLQRFYD